MWCNHARGAFFSAGNTTTNRIEANRNQLKLILGHRPRIERTVAGILAHQVAVFRQFLTVLRVHSSTARPAGSVPGFLRSVPGFLCDYPFRFVRKQWDIMCTSAVDARCVRLPSRVEWEVISTTRSYICDDRDWRCSCNFYKTNRLPCRHIMLVVRNGHELDALPEACIKRRWSMRSAATMYEARETSIEQVSPTLDSVRMRPRAKTPLSAAAPLSVAAPLSRGSSSNGAPRDHQRNLKNSITYVRLRRQEQASLVVMPSAEKFSYAQSLLSPVLEKLSSSSTASL